MNTANNNYMDDPHKYNTAREKLTKKNIECMARSHQVCKWSKLMGSREIRRVVIQGRELVVQGKVYGRRPKGW